MQELYATIDLGSNSFHMLTAALEFNELKILNSSSEKVMLAEGLSKTHGIASDAKQRGLDCIERFVQRLESIPRENIRIVGTNTLRAAVDSDNYISQLENILGDIPIEIISGVEEARLIYLGVNHTWSSTKKNSKQLVVDIGGGSTEFIIGESFSLKQAESLRMGCVAYRRFFDGDVISQTSFDNAERAAEIELSYILNEFDQKDWTCVVGSAGTFKAIEKLLVANEYTQEGITYSGLNQLKALLLSFNNMQELDVSGLKELRKKTILPGVAIAIAIFKLLNIESMQLSRGGLREGILYDLIGRHRAEDIRERSIEALSKRYAQQSSRIELNKNVSKVLLASLEKNLTRTIPKQHMQYLDWASSCSQIGLSISHSQYQNHSAYLIENSELHGFTLKERSVLAAIVKNHRRKIKLAIFQQLGLTELQIQSLYPVIFILRLCFIITQNGKNNEVKKFSLDVNGKSLTVGLTQSWIDEHSLIYHSIIQEEKYWAAIDVEFSISVLE